MKHVGKMKNNSAKVAVVYRTLPDDSDHALVVGTMGLGDSYHDSLISLIESQNGQDAYELADILAVRKFPDGSVMLGYLHTNGHLKRVPTNMVLMTPNQHTQIQLDELNKIIADQMGVSVSELAVKDPTGKGVKKTSPEQEVGSTYTNKNLVDLSAASEKTTVQESKVSEFKLSPSEMRDRAALLQKEAAALLKQAEELDSPVTNVNLESVKKQVVRKKPNPKAVKA